jgi:predicted secreted protein with PEFG-CTERM motif
MKSKSMRLLFGILTLVAIVTIYPHAFAQYQYGGDQARIIFTSSNSTQAAMPHSPPNSIPSLNGYSNSTHATTVTSSSNPTQATATPSSSNPTQVAATPQSTNAVPEFGSITPIILAISVIGIVVLTTKIRFFNIKHSSGT